MRWSFIVLADSERLENKFKVTVFHGFQVYFSIFHELERAFPFSFKRCSIASQRAITFLK